MQIAKGRRELKKEEESDSDDARDKVGEIDGRARERKERNDAKHGRESRPLLLNRKPCKFRRGEQNVAM